jgi:hypothetical protein
MLKIVAHPLYTVHEDDSKGLGRVDDDEEHKGMRFAGRLLT